MKRKIKHHKYNWQKDMDLHSYQFSNGLPNFSVLSFELIFSPINAKVPYAISDYSN